MLNPLLIQSLSRSISPIQATPAIYPTLPHHPTPSVPTSLSLTSPMFYPLLRYPLLSITVDSSSLYLSLPNLCHQHSSPSPPALPEATHSPSLPTSHSAHTTLSFIPPLTQFLSHSVTQAIPSSPTNYYPQHSPSQSSSPCPFFLSHPTPPVQLHSHCPSPCYCSILIRVYLTIL